MCKVQPDEVTLLNNDDPSVASSSSAIIPASSVMMNDVPQPSCTQLIEGRFSPTLSSLMFVRTSQMQSFYYKMLICLLNRLPLP